MDLSRKREKGESSIKEKKKRILRTLKIEGFYGSLSASPSSPCVETKTQKCWRDCWRPHEFLDVIHFHFSKLPIKLVENYWGDPRCFHLASNFITEQKFHSQEYFSCVHSRVLSPTLSDPFWVILCNSATIVMDYCCLRHQNVTKIPHSLSLFYSSRLEKKPFETNNIVVIFFLHAFWLSEQGQNLISFNHKSTTAGKPDIYEFLSGINLRHLHYHNHFL